MNPFEQLFMEIWNSAFGSRRPSDTPRGSTKFGNLVREGKPTSTPLGVTEEQRTEHIAVLGKTGGGKSMFLRKLAMQDIRARRGMAYSDLHGDTVPDLLRAIAAEEQRSGEDLSERTVVVEPGDPEYSVGLNVLERHGNRESFVQIAEFAQILKQRWHLEGFGARTEELLRNSLAVLTDAQCTLLELTPLLSNQTFRARCLQSCRNADVKQYFEFRFDRQSENMQAVYRDAILNKVSAFTTDPAFRHILGQSRSTFSLTDAIDRGHWVLLNLNKGQLGEHVQTLGGLFLTKLKNALFSRKSRKLYTLYADEIQNLVSFDSGLDTLLSEARKFGISVTSANQFLEQYPANMRSAILSVGTHVFFQLSSQDADKIASSLDAGKHVAQLLKNLPKRNCIVKSGHFPPKHVVVPTVEIPAVDSADLYRRSRARWAKSRVAVEAEIAQRGRAAAQTRAEVLNAWE